MTATTRILRLSATAARAVATKPAPFQKHTTGSTVAPLSLLLHHDSIPFRGATRYQSTATATATATTATTATTEDKDHPTLTKVPSLPLVGSLWQSYSQLPVEFKTDRVLDFWPAMHRQFGDFYQLGIPGLGVGLYGDCYILQDPAEMAKLLRHEGNYPRGAAEFAWAIRKFFTDRDMAVAGLIDHGPKWKRMRRFVQSDLLSPQAAQRYIPAILQAVQQASRGAQHHTEHLNEYLNLASFDMFTTVMLGTCPQVSNPATASEEDKEFCHHVAAALRLNGKLTQDPKQSILNNLFGIKTALFQEFEHHWGASQDIAAKHVMALLEKQQANPSHMTELEASSYAASAFSRQADPAFNSTADEHQDMYVTLEEAKTVVGGLISAGVDTTGGMLSFKLLHLAAHPHVQETLYQQLLPTLDADGHLTKESLALPYLTAMLRESHRLANANVTIPMKQLPEDLHVHGQLLPKGSVVMLDTYSVGMQQEHFVQPVHEFHPERFSAEAVAQRKGTKHAIVDHAFFSGPFSQGARKCPGSRVANLEAHALLSQWVLDWNMSFTGDDFRKVPYDQETLTTAQLAPGSIQFTARE